MNPDPCDKCGGMSHLGTCESYQKRLDDIRRDITATVASVTPLVADYDPNDATDRKYYDAAGIRAIDVIEAYGLNFALGCVVKYVLRAGRKTADKVKDLEKSYWYLGREIERLKAAK